MCSGLGDRHLAVSTRALPLATRLALAARRAGIWPIMMGVIALFVALPVLTVLVQLFMPAGDVWSHLATTVLPRYLLNTAGLALGVGVGVLVIGVGSAWLVVMCRFPGQRIFEWALLLPLAVPTYVIAYAYTDFLQFAGPLQTLLRESFGWAAGDYWFPPVRSLGGAITLLTLVCSRVRRFSSSRCVFSRWAERSGADRGGCLARLRYRSRARQLLAGRRLR